MESSVQTSTIPVSRRSLIARVERALRKEGKELRSNRRGRGARLLIIDSARRVIVQADVDLEELARKIECLQPWETLEAAR